MACNGVTSLCRQAGTTMPSSKKQPIQQKINHLHAPEIYTNAKPHFPLPLAASEKNNPRGTFLITVLI